MGLVVERKAGSQAKAPSEGEKVLTRPDVTVTRRGRGHDHCLVVNLRGEGTYFLK